MSETLPGDNRPPNEAGMPVVAAPFLTILPVRMVITFDCKRQRQFVTLHFAFEGRERATVLTFEENVLNELAAAELVITGKIVCELTPKNPQGKLVTAATPLSCHMEVPVKPAVPHDNKAWVEAMRQAFG